MANVSKYQRDVVIRCNHGVADLEPEYVSRYRFMAEQELWAPVDRGSTESTDVGGDGGDGWFPAKPAPGPRHNQQKIRCRCGKELSITTERLQSLLAMVAPAGQPVTVTGLQRILDRGSALMPKRRK
ncbi:hypothetical protein [Mycolicibacterium baixiangningiae]|uniref:hypothetical protein n=1 Tax=Mycolicibacterium baixiangningiae TaxID=2761578 RepID=UPI001866C543|nr:hypothetical protein [Mycolicibacterium baixiangningiae]